MCYVFSLDYLSHYHFSSLIGPNNMGGRTLVAYKITILSCTGEGDYLPSTALIARRMASTEPASMSQTVKAVSAVFMRIVSCLPGSTRSPN